MSATLELKPATVSIGKPGDVPDEIGPQCRRLMPEDILKRLDYEELNNVDLTPGTCRFCGKTLPVKYIVIPDTAFNTIGVFQCNRAYQLWDRAEALRQKRIADAERRRKEIVDSVKSGTPKRKGNYF